MHTLRCTLCVAVTKKEREQILALAEDCGLSVSEFLYHVLTATDEFGKRYPDEAPRAATGPYCEPRVRLRQRYSESGSSSLHVHGLGCLP
jgi:hypothetical protein